MQIQLPYFDIILSRLAQGDPDFQQAFGRHIHFGVWDDPEVSGADLMQTAEAMERMCQLLLDLADIQPGQQVLDVGCGFGGTLASLNERLSPVRMTGLNIDARQLEVARQRALAREGNQLDFVVGDACQLPFPDASFDRVLAVECIFHFPSRRAFFEHAARVLKPGGNLTLSDFVLPEGTPPAQYDGTTEVLWGPHTAIDLAHYQQLAAEVGLRLTGGQDISASVMPSYDFYGGLLGRYLPEAGEVTRLSKFFMQVGAFAYCTLRFDRS
ncbi:class I SAM-dependent methyltransferase [bacterium]|nr:class I SAM-dependent methyltransferase [bacterium]